MIPFIKNYRKHKLIYSETKQISSCLRKVVGKKEQEGFVAKGHKETLGVMDVHYLDCGNEFTCVCEC